MYTKNSRCLKSGATVFAMSALASLLLLTGCGGGSGGGGTAGPVAATSVISGVASKGPLNGSTVCAFAITAGVKGAALGACAKTNATGNYSIDLGTYTGPVLFEASGGNYIDEATGLTVPLASPLRSMLTNAAGGAASVAVTALTELAYQQANTIAAGLTVARIQAAVTNVQTNFGVTDIINTMPVDALNVPTAATAAQKSYALALATISQYQSTQPAGTSLVNALLPIQACLAAPATGCGTGATSVGTLLNAARTTFQTGHAALAGIVPPTGNFGSVTPPVVTPPTVTPPVVTPPTVTPPVVTPPAVTPPVVVSVPAASALTMTSSLAPYSVSSVTYNASLSSVQGCWVQNSVTVVPLGGTISTSFNGSGWTKVFDTIDGNGFVGFVTITYCKSNAGNPVIDEHISVYVQDATNRTNPQMGVLVALPGGGFTTDSTCQLTGGIQAAGYPAPCANWGFSFDRVSGTVKFNNTPAWGNLGNGKIYGTMNGTFTFPPF